MTTPPPTQNQDGVGNGHSVDLVLSVEGNTPNRPWWQIAKETVALIGGASVVTIAVAAALISFLGHASVSSYYANLNVPASLISLSTWEYNEWGWQYLLMGLIASSMLVFYGFYAFILYRMRIIVILPLNIALDILIQIIRLIVFYPLKFTLGLLLRFGKLIRDWFLRKIPKLSKPFEFSRNKLTSLRRYVSIRVESWWKSRIDIYKKRYGEKSYKFEEKLKQTYGQLVFIGFVCLVIFLLVFVLQIMFKQANNDGRKAAISFVSSPVLRSDIITNRPFVIRSTNVVSNIIQIDNNVLYNYQGLYFLTHNDGRYIFFDGVDTSCKPTNVYILKEDDVQSIHFTAVPSLNPACIATLTPTSQQAQPTLTPLSTPLPLSPTLTPAYPVAPTP